MIRNSAFLLCSAFIFCVFLATSPVWADEWIEGRVTSNPEFGKIRFIGVENVRYMVMPEAPIWERRPPVNGQVYELPIKLEQIFKGSRVMLMRDGSRILQLVLLR